MESEMSWLAANWLRAILAVGSIVTSGGVLQLARLYYQNKNAVLKLTLDTDTASDLAADKLRSHYSTELEALRTQITRQGDAHAERQRKADERYDLGMKAADEREEHCQAQVTKLREAVAELTKEVLGLRSALAQTGRSAIILAANVPSVPIQEAAERAATAIGEADDRLHNLPHTEAPE